MYKNVVQATRGSSIAVGPIRECACSERVAGSGPRRARVALVAGAGLVGTNGRRRPRLKLHSLLDPRALDSFLVGEQTCLFAHFLVSVLCGRWMGSVLSSGRGLKSALGLIVIGAAEMLCVVLAMPSDGRGCRCGAGNARQPGQLDGRGRWCARAYNRGLSSARWLRVAVLVQMQREIKPRVAPALVPPELRSSALGTVIPSGPVLAACARHLYGHPPLVHRSLCTRLDHMLGYPWPVEGVIFGPDAVFVFLRRHHIGKTSDVIAAVAASSIADRLLPPLWDMVVGYVGRPGLPSRRVFFLVAFAHLRRMGFLSRRTSPAEFDAVLAAVEQLWLGRNVHALASGQAACPPLRGGGWDVGPGTPENRVRHPSRDASASKTPPPPTFCMQPDTPPPSRGTALFSRCVARHRLRRLDVFPCSPDPERASLLTQPACCRRQTSANIKQTEAMSVAAERELSDEGNAASGED